MVFDLENCRSKDELEAAAQEMFGVDLDKRKKLAELKEEFKQLMETGGKTPEAPEVEEDFEAPKFVQHTTTRTVFHYQPHLRKRIGDELIPCNKDGKPV